MSRYLPISLSLPSALTSAILAILLVSPLMANADIYYVASVVGGKFQVVSEDIGSASSVIDHSRRGFSNDVANNAFNRQIMQSMREELLRADPKAEVMGLTINDKSILPADDDYDNANSVTHFIQAISKGLTIEPHTKLLVMVPWKSNVLMHHDSSENLGKKVEGFGFYVDHEVITDTSNIDQDAKTGDLTKGALAVFANVRLVMIDLNQGTLVAMQTFRSSDFYPATRSPSQDIMESATPQEELASLNTLLRRGVNQMIPTLLKQKGSVTVRLVE